MSLRLANRHKSIPISQAAAAFAKLVDGKTTTKIRVTSYVLCAAAATTVKFQQDDGTTKTDLTGAMSLAVGTPLSVCGSCESPVLIVEAGQDLGLVLGGTDQVSGHLTYTMEPAN